MSEVEPAPQPDTEAELYKQGLDAAGFLRHRRALIAKTALLAVGLAGGLGVIHGGYNADDHVRDRVEATVENSIPALNEQTMLEAQEFTIYEQMRDESQAYVKDPGRYSDTSFMNSMDAPSAHDAAVAIKALLGGLNKQSLAELSGSYDKLTAWQDHRDALKAKLYTKLPDNADDFELGYGLIALGLLNPLLGLSKAQFPITPRTYYRLRKGRYTLDNLDHTRDLAETAYDLTPSAGEPMPSKKEVKTYLKKVSLMPPVGSKIVTISEDKKFSNHPQEVRYSAESVVRNINNTKAELGKAFIHQLTVQGRLPDRFKYAGMALLMNSPLDNDWELPFYNAHWGSVGPLIHDGGNTRQGFNKRWRKVPGRTDFLQRIYVNLDEEQGDEAERDLAVLGNQAETIRMMTEARFYQRAAFALHCAEGTAPRSVPASVRKQLGGLWDDYEERFKSVLTTVGAGSVVDTPWFLDESREVEGWRSERYEADYQPIKESLVEFEEAKKKHPEVREIATRAMDDFSEKVDAVLDDQVAA